MSRHFRFVPSRDRSQAPETAAGSSGAGGPAAIESAAAAAAAQSLRRRGRSMGFRRTGVSGPLPENQDSRLSTTSWPMALRVWTEAEPTWRQEHDVVQRDERLRHARLVLEDVEPGGEDLPSCSASTSAASSTTRAAADIDQHAVGTKRRMTSASTMPLVSRAAGRDAHQHVDVPRHATRSDSTGTRRPPAAGGRDSRSRGRRPRGASRSPCRCGRGRGCRSCAPRSVAVSG